MEEEKRMGRVKRRVTVFSGSRVRPEAVDCAFYVKTVNCKYGANCKFNHPVLTKNQVNEDSGQKPGQIECKDQNICSYYSRYGICKFGPACKFNHPINLPILSLSDLDKPVASTS